mmetsp:Transcript_25734/g.50395  ORF Transcript_25734/g.50395 Transcript_25734/m.50395 type:complete len:99 (-) Transcript_25734:806-1102(-)
MFGTSMRTQLHRVIATWQRFDSAQASESHAGKLGMIEHLTKNQRNIHSLLTVFAILGSSVQVASLDFDACTNIATRDSSYSHQNSRKLRCYGTFTSQF